MKYSKLIDKVEKFAEKEKQGKPAAPKKLSRLQELLVDKIAHYEARLEDKDLSRREREIRETRLRVVKAQLKKSKALDASR
jgi:hypothetical protein